MAEIHHMEQIKVIPDWTCEEVELTVPRVTTREVAKPIFRTRVEETEELVEVPVSIPTVERIIEKPVVNVVPRVLHVKGNTEVIHTEETIDVPHVVEVPRMVAVPREEHRVVEKEVIVPHIRRVEKLVEVPQEQVVEKYVEVDQVHISKTIRHVPKFVHDPAA